MAQDMILSHRAKFQLIINFFQVKAISTRQVTSTSPVFTRKNTFEKELSSGNAHMLTEQIIKFELRVPGLTGRTCAPITGYFEDKAEIFEAIFERIIIYF